MGADFGGLQIQIIAIEVDPLPVITAVQGKAVRVETGMQNNFRVSRPKVFLQQPHRGQRTSRFIAVNAGADVNARGELRLPSDQRRAPEREDIKNRGLMETFRTPAMIPGGLINVAPELFQFDGLAEIAAVILIESLHGWLPGIKKGVRAAQSSLTMRGQANPFSAGEPSASRLSLREMKSRCFGLFVTVFALGNALAQVPENLVAEKVPPIPPEIKSAVGRYLEFRAAGFSDWHPRKREMSITTRFADATQLHMVKMPGGARRQLTFLPEPVSGGSFDPKQGAFVVFSQDSGGGEFFQLHRYDLADGRITLLTDGKSRNTGPHWANSGDWLAYASTRRTGRDTDIFVMNPRKPESDRLVLQVKGGGWRRTRLVAR